MTKPLLTIVLALVLGGCAARPPSENKADRASTVEPTAAGCSFGFSRCTGQYATGGGACYDPTKANCHSGQVCSFGFKLCVKNEKPSCISSTANC